MLDIRDVRAWLFDYRNNFGTPSEDELKMDVDEYITNLPDDIHEDCIPTMLEFEAYQMFMQLYPEE